MKALITGITGFAGSHLAELLLSEGTWEIFGIHATDRNLQNVESIKNRIHLEKVNLSDASETGHAIEEMRPDVIFHLAGSAGVGNSFAHASDIINNNSTSQINVLDAIIKNKLFDTKIVIISSAYVYGLVSSSDLPISESTPFKPNNPYSVSKITQDYLGFCYHKAYNLPIFRLRPFTHIGTRQTLGFVLSDFAKQIAEIEKGTREPVLHVGDLEARRDFTDVRDMVRAYVLASEKCKVGEAYNIGTGVSRKIGDVLDKLVSMSSVSIKVEADEKLFRRSDIPELRCDATKFKEVTGWEPAIPLEKTLQDILDYWRKIV